MRPGSTGCPKIRSGTSPVRDASPSKTTRPDTVAPREVVIRRFIRSPPPTLIGTDALSAGRPSPPVMLIGCTDSW
jgi:hypothetical protein